MAVQNAHQLAAAAALRAKRGQASPRRLSGTARALFDRHTPDELTRLAGRKR